MAVSSQLTDMMMMNPFMFDPTQASNQFSNFNNAPLPWPPSYNGVPTNAMGQPIQSFQQWQQQNPAGVTLNQTPAAPAAAAPTAGSGYMLDPRSGPNASLYAVDPSAFTQGQGALAVDPTTGKTLAQANAQLQQYYAPSQMSQVGGTQEGRYGGGGGGMVGGSMQGMSPAQMYGLGQAITGGGQRPQQAAPQAGGPPNNWQAALNALANPGPVTTPGATVPMAQGYQPAGGVNQAFLNRAGGGAGMNQNFLANLRAIQGR